MVGCLLLFVIVINLLLCSFVWAVVLLMIFAHGFIWVDRLNDVLHKYVHMINVVVSNKNNIIVCDDASIST